MHSAGRGQRVKIISVENRVVCRCLTFELSRLGHTKREYAKQRCVVQVGLNERLGLPRQSALFNDCAFAFFPDVKNGELRQRRHWKPLLNITVK